MTPQFILFLKKYLPYNFTNLFNKALSELTLGWNHVNFKNWTLGNNSTKSLWHKEEKMKNDTFLRSYLFCINQNPTTFEMKIHFKDYFFFFSNSANLGWIVLWTKTNSIFLLLQIPNFHPLFSTHFTPVNYGFTVTKKWSCCVKFHFILVRLWVLLKILFIKQITWETHSFTPLPLKTMLQWFFGQKLEELL